MISYTHKTVLPDTILYTVVTEGGGQDGLDHNDKGGVVIMATFNKEEAETKKGQDSRLRIEKAVVNQEDVTCALKKLDKVEAFLIENYFTTNAKVKVTYR